MALRKRPIAAGITALFFSSWVSAVGLGEIKLNSALNEPLDAEIRLLNTGELGEAEILAGLASPTDFANAGIDRELVHNSLVFRLDMGAAGGPLLRLMSNKPIREPYLDLLVDLQWPSGRLLREYTLLLDLPVFSAGASPQRVSRSAAAPQQPARSAPVAQPSARSTGADQRFRGTGTIPAVSGEQYQVGAGDTLWGIASRLSGSESVQQKMAAIQQLNPEAFIGGDRNLLRSGQVLRLPDYGQIAAAAPRPSAESVDGEVARRQRSEVMAPQLNASSRGSDPQDAVETPEPQLSGQLRLSAIDPNTANETDFITGSSASSDVAGGVGEAIRGELSSIQEEMARTQRENADLKERLVRLEEQLSTMQRLIEIEDGGLRAAQLAAAGTETLSVAPQAGDSGSTETDTDLASSADTGTAPVKPNEQKIKSEKGWFDTVNSYLAYAVGFLVLLIGALVFAVLKKRSRDAQPEEDYFTISGRDGSERESSVPRGAKRHAVDSAPQASSLDDIDLSEDDDIFALQPAAESNFARDREPFEDDFQELVEPSPVVPAPESRTPPQVVHREEIEDLELDLSEFELDDFQSTESTPAPAAAKFTDPLNLDDEFDFLHGADEGETQLELAQAYIEMGDSAGAREILQEVLDGGSEAHQDLARALLAKIS